MLQTLWTKFKKPRYEHHINQTVVTLNPAFFYDLRFLCNCTLIFFFLFQKVLYSLIKDFFFFNGLRKNSPDKAHGQWKQLVTKIWLQAHFFFVQNFFQDSFMTFRPLLIFFLSSLLTHSIHNYYLNATIFVSSVICHCFWLVQ